MRQRKPGKNQAFLAVEGENKINLIRGGRRAVLWVGPVQTEDLVEVYTFSGPAALRALARAILREVPAPKPKRGRADR